MPDLRTMLTVPSSQFDEQLSRLRRALRELGCSGKAMLVLPEDDYERVKSLLMAEYGRYARVPGDAQEGLTFMGIRIVRGL
jgi:hypothetical protein